MNNNAKTICPISMMGGKLQECTHESEELTCAYCPADDLNEIAENTKALDFKMGILIKAVQDDDLNSGLEKAVKSLKDDIANGLTMYMPEQPTGYPGALDALERAIDNGFERLTETLAEKEHLKESLTIEN